ncbi:MAG: non-heme iron oxygenase ferredoxin subunit [Gammaproteobacteria bacterium]|nr:non-heme iron oxygenase ferredoxin subunit [Gammaproteobacteria bacterium]MBU1440235.1 non-heme iron oxygenase ferredoxin subunit [Gammaproteobacteria bacterium]MBU2288512.1 non-heme iron oxygenase ferredoxin subunit [Gammaproteobacteria bacterium]
MADWHCAGNFDDVWEGVPLAVTVGGQEVALYKVGADVHATGNLCPHQKDVKLSDGYLDGDTIECPMHQSCFNIKTGKVLSPPAREDIPVFQVRVEDGKVFVEV